MSRFVFKLLWFYLILNKFADAVTSLYLIWNQVVDCFKVVLVSCCVCWINYISFCLYHHTCYTIKKDLDHLQKVQNAVARILTNTQYITSVLISLLWLLVHFKILVLTFRALCGQAPVYISDLFDPFSFSLRSWNQRLLMVPQTHFITWWHKAFRAVAPETLCCIASLNTFQKQLKTHLFKLAFI